MLRWLLRLLIIALVLFVAVRVVSRVLNQDEDFDDFEDIDIGFEFTETPVEIDVPMEAGASMTGQAPVPAPTAVSSEMPAGEDTEGGEMQSLIDVNGIGPTYASRLNEVGIQTLEDLAGADADELAEKVSVIGGRDEIENWIEQARSAVSGGTQPA